LECLQALMNIMESRKQKLVDAKVTNISDYNKISDNPLPRIIIVFDEVADVLGMKKTKSNKEMLEAIEESISKLVRLGRAFGLHCILCYQRPSSEALSGDIKANLGIRICGCGADRIMSNMVLDNDIASEIITNSKGCFVEKTKGFFKAYYLPDNVDE